MSSSSPKSTDILPVLHQVLEHLSTNPHPHVPTPAGCKKRASVAIVIRVRPAYNPLPAVGASTVNVGNPTSPATSLETFFSQDWVKDGDPEILFIKRAGREGDRWSGHVALPGGRRDPEDESDAAAAVRETREEVGLELNTEHCLYAGNLPERIVATTFGKAPLMVLCPFIYLLTSKDVQRVSPQPTEVASAHWVPIRALLAKSLRTREYVDTASRMAKQGGPLARALLRATVGKMVFSAIQLTPSESVYASSTLGFIPETCESHVAELVMGTIAHAPSLRQLTNQQPLLLWGLTLGVLADLLDMLPPYNAVELWRYPTFTPPDLRAIIYLFTYTIRQRKNNPGDFSAGTWPYKTRKPLSGNDTAVDATSEAIVVTESEPTMSGLSAKPRASQNADSGIINPPTYAVGRLVAGYYERVNIAIACFVIYRAALGTAFGYWMFKIWKRRWLPV